MSVPIMGEGACLEIGGPVAICNSGEEVYPQSDLLVAWLTRFLTRTADVTSDDQLLAELDYYYSLRQYLDELIWEDGPNSLWGLVTIQHRRLWASVAGAAIERAAAWRRDEFVPTNSRESYGTTTENPGLTVSRAE